jgi:hypothetical protein
MRQKNPLWIVWYAFFLSTILIIDLSSSSGMRQYLSYRSDSHLFSLRHLSKSFRHIAFHWSWQTASVAIDFEY